MNGPLSISDENKIIARNCSLLTITMCYTFPHTDPKTMIWSNDCLITVNFYKLLIGRTQLLAYNKVRLSAKISSSWLLACLRSLNFLSFISHSLLLCNNFVVSSATRARAHISKDARKERKTQKKLTVRM